MPELLLPRNNVWTKSSWTHGAALCLLPVLLVALFATATNIPGPERYNYRLLSAVGILLLSAAAFSLNRIERIEITWPDCFVILYLLSDLIVLALHPFTIDGIIAALSSVALALLYCCLRFAAGSRLQNILPYGLIGFSLVLSLSTHLNYVWDASRSGMLGNSGYNGIAIAITGIPLLTLLRERAFRWLWYGAAATIATAVIISGSRTACLAVAACGLLHLLRRRQGWNNRLLWAGCGLLLVAGLVLAKLTQEKLPSTEGRVFMWLNSLQVISDNPVSGTGLGNFSFGYNQAQAEYFRQHADSPFIHRADNVAHPFNDYLFTAAEGGIFQFILLLLLVFSIARASNSRLYLPVVAIFICGLFSYSFSFWPLRVLAILMIACGIESRPVRSLAIPNAVRAGLIALCLSIATGFFYLNRLTATWKTATESVFLNPQRSMALYGQLFPKLHTSNAFSFCYANDLVKLGRPAEAIALLRQLETRYNASGLFTLQGFLYEQQGQDKAAIEAFYKAHYTEPAALTPLYSIFLIRQRQGDIPASRSLARQILSIRPKVRTTVSTQIQKQATEYLIQTSHE
jgi:O-antigen ligase